MAPVRSLRRDVPLPCTGCGADVWHACMGVCDACFERAYQAFLKAMGWPLLP